MKCSSGKPLARTPGSHAASRGARALVPLSCAALVACGSVGDPQTLDAPTTDSSSSAPSTESVGVTAATTTGSTGMTDVGPASTVAADSTATETGSATTSSSTASDATSTDTTPPVPLSQGGVTLRVLTQAEYTESIKALLGTLTADLTVASDTPVAGFVAVGAGLRTVTDAAATDYEAASRAAVAEVFGDSERWQELVGCAPADMNDACVATYVETFGRQAYRRDLTDEEVQQWVGVAQSAMEEEESSVEQGLSAATIGILQSPFFLYRVEVNSFDQATSRLKYDGLSMATRLAYTVTGRPPSSALLDSAKSGQLDTADGVKQAVASLLQDPAVSDRMAAFFREYSQIEQVSQIAKSNSLFPEFTPELQSSMLEGAELFLKNIVLGPNADVRSFYNGRQTYTDANLAELYQVDAPANGFEEVTLPAETQRAGILGQAALLAGHSQPDRTSPTRRGVFILESLLCIAPPPVPEDADTTFRPKDGLTTRQNLEAHREDEKCAGCHALFDPLGIALENFDPIGRYRDTENGQPIDASGEWAGAEFVGGAELGGVLAENPQVLSCLMRNFYRNANGRAEDDKDTTQIEAMATSLAAKGYVWKDFLGEFLASDAFRSAPALPVTTMTTTENPEHGILEGPQTISTTRSSRYRFWHWCVSLAADVGHHVQHQRHGLRPKRPVSHDVWYLLLG